MGGVGKGVGGASYVRVDKLLWFCFKFDLGGMIK